MNKFDLLKQTLIVLAMATSVAQGAVVLINFGGTNVSYTSDGTNTWQTFNYDQDANGNFDTIASTGLLTTGNAASGWSFALTPDDNSIEEFGTSGQEALLTSSKPVTGFDWFDPAVAEQRASSAINENEGNGNAIQYSFSGFQAADEVTFQFVINRASGSGNRRVNFWEDGVGTLASPNILDAQQTATVAHFITYTVTGSTSYNFFAGKNQTDSPAGVVNAMAITVVPEPATYAALLGALALGFVMWRRR